MNLPLVFINATTSVLLSSLKTLKKLGNTVIVVEHDQETIENADHVVDMGPGAGRQGGRVVAQGTPAAIRRNPNSLTGQYLCGKKRIELPAQRRPFDQKRKLKIIGAQGNNLKDINVEIPLGRLVVVTGVSGSGKSTLINETLYKRSMHVLHNSNLMPAPCKTIQGLEKIDKIINIDQSPIGRTPRSNPATYTGLFTPITRTTLPACPKPAPAATPVDASASTCAADDVKLAKAKA